MKTKVRRGLVAMTALLACGLALSGSALADGLTFTVNSASDGDDGACDGAHCSLREAINAANAAPGHDTIVFEISGNGVHTILAVGSPPIITNPVTIDATTEDDYTDTPRVELDGLSTGGANGLWFSVDSGGPSTVRGLAINRWGPGITTQAGTTVSVEDSYIGVSAGDGVTPRPNQTGISFLGGSNHVVEGSLISGNAQAGLRFQDVAGATVQGNRIGTNAAGTAAVANGLGNPFNPFSGLEIAPTALTGASAIVIGGSGTGEGNLISGNGRSGIDIYPSTGRPVDDVTIRGNLIGTDAVGAAAIANGWHGIHIRGFNVNGPTTDTTIGGTAAGQGNTIAFNGQDGIAIDTNAPGPENLRNAIRGNSIHSNGGNVQHLGIDLDANGITGNDPPANLDADVGANGLQNFPVFTEQVVSTVEGELSSGALQAYSIDIYSSPDCDPSGNGEGRAFVETVSVNTDESGHDAFSTTQPLPYPGGFVTATATDSSGNTSEFSPCFDVTAVPQTGPLFTVNTDADAAPADAGCTTADCTLREAIVAANGHPAADKTVEFDIGGGGPRTIAVASPLPAIGDGVALDATTQGGFAGTPLIELDGSAVIVNGDHGLVLAGTSSMVRGFVINDFEGAGTAGILVSGASNVVEGNYVGTDVTGDLAHPNRFGIVITGNENTVGGETVAARNVISGNTDDNVQISGAGATTNTVAGNYIGTTASGTGALEGGGVRIEDSALNTVGGATQAARNVIAGNDGNGVEIFGPSSTGNTIRNNYIGIDATGLGVVANSGAGVEIVGTSASNEVMENLISGNTGGVIVGGSENLTAPQSIELNRIGLDEGEGVPGNSGHGIYLNGRSLSDTSGSTINGNEIAGSSGDGIRIDATDGTAVENALYNNSIWNNGGLAIELVDDSGLPAGSTVGVTPNDVDDVDDGANRFQNFPVLTSATAGGGETVIEGTLNSTPGRQFAIEFFSNPSCDGSGNGEARNAFGGASVTTDAGGDVAIDDSTPVELEIGHWVAALARDLTTGDTSELSACVAVEAAEGGPQPGPTFTVNTSADLGIDPGCTVADCTLREAIVAANNQAGPNTIEFEIGAGGHQVITPSTALPPITEAVSIDGTTQSGWSGAPIVELDGTTVTNSGSLPAHGLRIEAGGSTVRGLVINSFVPAGGVEIAGGIGTLVAGNYIGTDVTGTIAEPNGNGVVVTGASNTIGGTTAADRNVISGNFGANVLISGEAADGNTVQGNYIGPDAAGTAAISSDPPGVAIELGADENKIGGAIPEAGNVISGNAEVGVFITGAGTEDNSVASNYIGLDATGLAALPNVGAGVMVNGSSTSSITGNFITGNFEGLVLGIAETGSSGNVVTDNGIGIATDGTVLGNQLTGITVDGSDGGNSSGNVITSNTVAGSGGTGILVNAVGGVAAGNIIRLNEVSGNDALGIDLAENLSGVPVLGVTPNDGGDGDTGSNNLQNFPVLSSAQAGATETLIEGSLSSTPNTTFAIDFYSSPGCDPSGNGEGRVLVGFTEVTTNGGGDADISEAVDEILAPGSQVTATATDLGTGDTSEFSACSTVLGGPQSGPLFEVNTTADGAPADAGCSFSDCTLREAIVAANGDGVASTITFEIPGPGPHTIALDSALPVIASAATIDATTQTGWTGAPVVEISGDVGGIGNGLTITGSPVVVRGLVIGGFAAHGIDATGGGLTLHGSYIGTTVDGSAGHPNGVGVRVLGSVNTIGGSGPNLGNVISGNDNQGLLLQDSSTNTVAGNRVGTDAAGTVAIPNTTGIEISTTGPDAASINTIEGNLVSGNVSAGILLRSDVGAAGVEDTVIRGNLVGTAADGVSDLGNGGDGIQLGATGGLTGNEIGGTGTGEGNTIKFNDGPGVSIIDAPGNVGNTIRGNSIDGNGGLGIDLNANGATANDPGDADGGANGSQNFPVITSVTANETQTEIDAELNSAPTTTYQIDFYASPTCDGSGFGEGATYLGSGSLLTGPGGNFTIVFVHGAPLAAGTQITATATDPSGNTSELSACAAVVVDANTYLVNSSEDTTPDVCDGEDCTLREAILAANGDGTASTIQFGLITPSVILGSPLPDVTAKVSIDGRNTGEGPRVTVDGSAAGPADGLVLAVGSGGSSIDALALLGFDDLGTAALRVLSAGNTITDSHFSGVTNGIVVEGAGAGGNTIGGSFPAGEGNRFWNFSRDAIHLDTAPAGIVIAGNTIGIDPGGTVQEVPPGSNGIFVLDTPSPVIGHNAGPGDLFLLDFSRANVVVRTSIGIAFEAGVTGAIVAGNYLGVTRAGASTDLETPTTGLELSGGSDNNQLGPGNTIAHNGAHGLRINGSGGNRIVANSIHSNGQLGISLNSANGGIAAPALFNAFDTGANTATVSGSVDGPNGTYVVEFFRNATCDPSGNGEGEGYRGFAIVTITNGSSASFVADTFPGVALGDVITATSTRFFSPVETSEFSNCKTVVVEAAPPVAPVLFGAVADVQRTPTSPFSLGVAGLVNTGVQQANQVVDVRFYSVPECNPGAPRTLLGTGDDFVTNENGIAAFAKDGLTDVDIGTIVVATSTIGAGAESGISNCVVADRNNTSWHTAFELDPNDTDPFGALRASGQARWFKVPILPNSRVRVSLSNLPADYDLVVFSDIQQAYTRLVGTNVDPAIGPNLAITDLIRAGAETQTDVFNTSQYDSSTWDPTNWEPDLNSSVFSPSEWSPSEWSPSEWSATHFSPSEWSPSEWSPSEWSPSEWSPSEWSPSEWSPSQWSPSEWSDSNPADPRAFSSAQTASLLAVSAGPGTGNENVAVNTWNNTGYFYFRVQGKNGSFDADSPFTLSVAREGNLCAPVEDLPSAPVAAPGLGAPKTLILRDSRRIASGAFLSRLQTLAARPDVQGHIVDVDADLTVRALNQQADDHPSCPFAKNLVASAIKRIVDEYRQEYPSLEYLVVVGDDDVIPFFRYPDPALMGSETLYVPPVRDDTASQASLRLGYILSDDFLASSKSISLHGTQFPVPDLSMGRLVEEPNEIAGLLDAYLDGTSGGVVPTPTTSLTTGYDFLTDAADTIAGHLREGIGQTGGNRTLITDQAISPATTTEPGLAPTRDQSWTADDLRSALLDPTRKSIVFLAGHFSANDALAADYKTNILTTELAASPADLQNAIVFSAGCHTGYNIVNEHATTWTEPLDWAQAFAQKRATLISGTGYQYGDTDFMAHSERIYAEFARQLRVTTTEANGVPVPEAVPVGGALLRAKQLFLEQTPGLTSLDEKTLLQTTLFGLPMLSVNLPQGRIVDEPEPPAVPALEPVGAGPGAELGLKSADVSPPLNLALQPPKTLTNDLGNVLATWLEGPDGVAVRPTQPILPLQSLNVTSPDPLSALRGVAFRGGTYVDQPGQIPLTAAPATELRGIHAPFITDVFFPTQPWNVNYFGALGGGDTFLHLTPVQHRSESPTMTRRVFEDLDLKLFYSGNVTSYCPDTGPPLLPSPCAPGEFGPVAAVTPALAAPPTITGVETSFADGVLRFKARAVGDPFAGIQSVFVTWTVPPGVGLEGTWRSLDLTRDAADPALWTGALQFDGQDGRPAPPTDPGNLNFVVQAVNGVGRVTLDHNLGAFYRPGSIPGIGAVEPGGPPPAATSLVFVTPPPASVEFGEEFEVVVELTTEAGPVAGKDVRVGIGSNGMPVETDAAGRARIVLRAALTPGPYQVTTSFEGDAQHAPAGASAPIQITRRPTTLVIGGELAAAPNTVHATLEAVPSQPLHQRSVFLVFTGTGPTNVGHTDVFAGKTDPTGSVDVTDEFLAQLPVGSYRIDAYFNGVNLPGVLVLPPDSPEYEPATATATMNLRALFTGFFSPVANPPTFNTVQAGRTIPVKFSLGGDRGLAIFQAGYPKVTTVPCQTQASTHAIKQAASTGSSGLTFDATTGLYTYLWKTQKGWTGCRQLTLRFADGTERYALFRFTK